ATDGTSWQELTPPFSSRGEVPNGSGSTSPDPFSRPFSRHSLFLPQYDVSGGAIRGIASSLPSPRYGRLYASLRQSAAPVAESGRYQRKPTLALSLGESCS